MIKKSKKFLALGLSLAALVSSVGNFSAFAAGDGESSHTATESQPAETKSQSSAAESQPAETKSQSSTTESQPAETKSQSSAAESQSAETKSKFEAKKALTFDQKTGILTVYSEDGLRFIKDNPSHFENVEKIILGENVKYILDGVFNKLLKLKTVEGNNVEEIEGCAFSGCFQLTTVVLPNATKSYSHAFFHCAQLSTVVLTKLTEIGEGFFEGCTSLKNPDIPEVTNIKEGAFKGCTNLESVNFDKDKCTVDASAFENSNLTFDKQKGLTPRAEEKPTFNEETGKLEINSYMQLIYAINHQELYNMAKEIYFGKSIEFIPSNAFKGWKYLEKVSTESINFIGEYAFQGCINLKEVINLSTSIIEISYGRYAFSGCTNLTKVEGNINEFSVIAIDEFAFEGCHNLKIFPEIQPTAVVNPNAFDNSGLIFIGNRYLVPRSNMEIVKSVKDVTKEESKITVPLEKVQLESEGMTYDPKTNTLNIHSYYYGNSAIVVEIVNPEPTVKIAKTEPKSEKTTCDYDEKAKTLTIHSQSEIENIFWSHPNYEKATTVILEDDVKYIPTGTFRRYANLEKIEGSGVKRIEVGAFINCANLKEVSLPAAEEIQESAFRNCTSLENIELPEAKIIGEHAFNGCLNLKNITIPKAILILYYSFFDCINLKNVEFNSEKCYVHQLAFEHTNFKLDEQNRLVLRSIEPLEVKNGVLTILSNFDFVRLRKMNSSEEFKESVRVVVLGNSISYIPSEAFRYYVNLRKVEGENKRYGSYIHVVDKYAFQGCRNLESVDAYFTSKIGECAFQGCTRLSKIDFCRGIKIIENDAFGDCENLVSVSDNPDKLGNFEKIGVFAFKNCKNLKPFEIGESCEVGDAAFYGSNLVCTKLNKLKLRSEVSDSETTRTEPLINKLLLRQYETDFSRLTNNDSRRPNVQKVSSLSEFLQSLFSNKDIELRQTAKSLHKIIFEERCSLTYGQLETLELLLYRTGCAISYEEAYKVINLVLRFFE